jgi:hypothetical protein
MNVNHYQMIAWLPWVMQHKKGSFLFVSHCPRKPSKCTSAMVTTSILANKSAIRVNALMAKQRLINALFFILRRSTSFLSFLLKSPLTFSNRKSNVFNGTLETCRFVPLNCLLDILFRHFRPLVFSCRHLDEIRSFWSMLLSK